MKLYCIADPDTLRGLRLAGIEGESVATPEQAAAALTRAVDSPACGIILLPRSLADPIRPLVDRLRTERELPLILEIPGFPDRAAERGNLRSLVQRAVGIDLGQEAS